MEKAKNVVLVVCGTILFFGSRAASAFWLYIFAWLAGISMLIAGIVGLAQMGKKKREAEALRELFAASEQAETKKPTKLSENTNKLKTEAELTHTEQPTEGVYLKTTIPKRIGNCIQAYFYPDVPLLLLDNADSVLDKMAHLGNTECCASQEDAQIVLSYDGEIFAELLDREDMVEDWLLRDDPFIIGLSSFDGDNTATAYIAFFRDEEKRLASREMRVYKLTHYADEIGQIGLIDAEPGDKLKLRATYDSDSYEDCVEVSNGCTIGRLPKSAANRYLAIGAGGAFIDHLEYDERQGLDVPFVRIYW